MILLYTRFPATKTTNPSISTKIAPTPTNYHLKFGRSTPAVTVTIIPITQTSTVRVTSQIDLVNALIYLVTVTPEILKVAIENIPKITKNSNTPF